VFHVQAKPAASERFASFQGGHLSITRLWSHCREELANIAPVCSSILLCLLQEENDFSCSLHSRITFKHTSAKFRNVSPGKDMRSTHLLAAPKRLIYHLSSPGTVSSIRILFHSPRWQDDVQSGINDLPESLVVLVRCPHDISSNRHAVSWRGDVVQLGIGNQGRQVQTKRRLSPLGPDLAISTPPIIHMPHSVGSLQSLGSRDLSYGFLGALPGVVEWPSNRSSKTPWMAGCLNSSSIIAAVLKSSLLIAQHFID
jgi:hypothetical protein